MADVTTLTTLDLVFVLVVSVSVAALAWRNRPRPGTHTLTAFALLVAVWEFSHLLAHLTPATQVFRQLRWIGIGSAAFVWFLFVLAYVGRDDLITPRTTALAVLWPVAVNASIWLPEGAAALGLDLGGSVWPGLYEGTSGLYWAHVLLSYGLFVVGSAMLVRFLWRSHRVFRAQGVAILLGVGALWVGSVITVLELFGDIHVHFLPAGLTFMSLAFLWATTRGRLTDLMPVATSAVLDTIDAGVLVVDRDGRVVEVNDTMYDLFGVPSSSSVIGRSLAKVPSQTEAGLGTLADIDGSQAVLEPGDRTVEVSVSTLRDARDRVTGRVFLCRDVTAQRERETALRRQKDRLEQFSRIISHDLRNPLNVATGRLSLARETGDLSHLDDVENALGRIEKIVEQTLTLAREGRTVEQDALEAVSVADLAAESWQMVATGDATLDVDADHQIVADADRLRHVFENLFRNAIEHGGEAVTVRVGRLDDGGFFVEDDGPGIPPDRRESLFEVGPQGSGLGLGIVAEIVQAFGWEIAVTAGRDGGARFEVTGVDLPRS